MFLVDIKHLFQILPGFAVMKVAKKKRFPGLSRAGGSYAAYVFLLLPHFPAFLLFHSFFTDRVIPPPTMRTGLLSGHYVLQGGEATDRTCSRRTLNPFFPPTFQPLARGRLKIGVGAPFSTAPPS